MINSQNFGLKVHPPLTDIFPKTFFFKENYIAMILNMRTKQILKVKLIYYQVRIN